MKDFAELTSVRGVNCHDCRTWIRPQKVFFRYTYDTMYPKYKNHCVKCIQAVIDLEIDSNKRHLIRLKSINEKAKRLTKVYKAVDSIICRTCTNKYKHITDKCHPTRNCQKKYGKR